MSEHKKSGGGSQEVQWRSTLLQAEEWEGMKCQWTLERRSVALRKNSNMTGPYRAKCADRYEDREDADSLRAPSGMESDGEKGKRDFAGECGEVGTKQNHFEHVSREQLVLTLCDWKQFLELGHLAKTWYESENGVMGARFCMVEHDEQKQSIDEIGSLTRRGRIDGRRMEGLNGPSVKV